MFTGHVYDIWIPQTLKDYEFPMIHLTGTSPENELLQQPLLSHNRCIPNLPAAYYITWLIVVHTYYLGK